MTGPGVRGRGASLAAIAAFLAVAVAGIAMRPVLPVDETRYLAVAWEMWLGGDYLVPTKNFALYTDKPPLLFWLINLVWSVIGVSDVAARLVGPTAAAIAIALTGRLAARLWPDDPGIAGRASLVLAGNLIFAIIGGLTMFDALLALTAVASISALVAAAQTGARRWWVAAGLAIGLGVLTKGPVILIHTLPAMLAVPLWSPVRVPRRTLALGIAIALGSALALVALWLVPAAISGGPAYREAILWTQSAGRISQSFAHAQPWWFYLSLVPLLLFPWCLIPALWRAARAANWSEAGLRLALVWAGVALLVFSLISGKQVHYLIPDLPAVALVVARLTRQLPFRPTVAVVPVALLALVALAAAAGLVPLGEASEMLQPRWVLAAWGLALLALSWGAVRLGGLLGATALTLGTVLAINALAGLTQMRSMYDTRPIAALLADNADHGIAAYGQRYHAEFNFEGRLTAPVAEPQTEEALRDWVASHPKGLIYARIDRTAPPWEPALVVPFRNSPHGIWNAADAAGGGS